MMAGRWLARLKSRNAPVSEPTEPTEPGSVGFVGSKTEESDKSLTDVARPAANDCQPDPDPDRWCAPNGPAMTRAEQAAFAARLQRFTSHGLELMDAEALADKLLYRDRDGDDRRVCLECSYLGASGRCIAAATGRLVGASAPTRACADHPSSVRGLWAAEGTDMSDGLTDVGPPAATQLRRRHRWAIHCPVFRT